MLAVKVYKRENLLQCKQKELCNCLKQEKEERIGFLL